METQPRIEKKSGNKTIIIIGVVLLVCLCTAVIVVAAFTILGPAIQNTTQQVQQGLGYSGIADAQLRTDTMKLLGQSESGNGCDNISLTSGQVVSQPDPAAGGSWTELWQVSACGKTHAYTIVYTPYPSGGTDIHITSGN
jgi:hypothetical protein